MNRSHRIFGAHAAPACVVLLGLVAGAAPALAVPTGTIKVSTFDELNKGQPKGTFISSEGEVVAGWTAKRIKTKNTAAMIWSTVTDEKGTVYLGTGDKGHLLAVRDGKVRLVAKLKTVLVTSLARGPGGKLLAGTMPDAKILEVDPKSGKWRQLAKLPAQHVWALLYDAKAGRVYAASGSPGKVFSIPAGGGKPQVHYDPGEKHLLCLARDRKGALLTGSADKAILYRVTGKGKGTAVHDFDATELKDVVVGPDGTIHAAANKFTLKTSGLPRFDRTKDGEGGTPITVSKKKKTTKVRPQELRPGAKTGKGAVYRITPGGGIDQLLALDKGYFTDLALDSDGLLWAGEGTKGKVYLFRKDRTVLTAFDLSERQVLALAVGGKQRYIGTGDAGAIHRVEKGGPTPAYLSDIFDAKYSSRWGNLHYLATGVLHLESKTGNTAKPDHTWTGWKRAQPLMGGMRLAKLASPPGRYVQLKFSWRGQRKIALRSFTLYHLPRNQRARVTEITFDGAGSSDKDKKPAPKTAKIKIKWKVDNPDKDTLVYRLYARQEMGLSWRKINGEKPLDKTEFEWDTEPVADGYYRVKVVASDEKANAQEATLKSSRVSARLLVDNRKPEIVTPAVAFPWVSGTARDSYSPVKRIEFSLDGKPWRLVGPIDGIYDNRAEVFRFRLPATLERGSHTIAIRAIDAADNMGVVQISFLRK